ncbi:MAG: hypothetical protein CSA26_08705 [Desulfobacterales bacterium]|nr:MAG: hypothetical protein CSA26_08705 [Desulfobacterales bacterium]
MTTILKKSSELAQSAKLISDLLVSVPESLQYDVFHQILPPAEQMTADEKNSLFAEEESFKETIQERQLPVKRPDRKAVRFTEIEGLDNIPFTGDKLEKLLANLCRQSGFSSAVIADEKGLPISGVNTPVTIDILAAFSSVLGNIIDKVPYFLKQYEAGHISIDINYVDKIVVQKILVEEESVYLLIICSQDIDERAYIELFSDQIIKILKR